MIKTPKAKEYGKRMRDISAKYLNKNVKLFKATEEGFEDDIQMIYKDAAGLYMIGSYMLEGNFDAAMGVASSLDTAVRDEIPKSIWNYLEKYTLDQE
jgi:hypothetical protein